MEQTAALLPGLLYLRRRTAALILRPAITCWPAVAPANVCDDLEEHMSLPVNQSLKLRQVRMG